MKEKMKRSKFIKSGIVGLSSVMIAPVISGCMNEDDENSPNENNNNSLCKVTPTETLGPFVIKSPADLVRGNIISDRKGIPLLIKIIVKSGKDCNLVPDVFVDLWHCDAIGEYSEYGGVALQQVDHTDKHFLRGRQKTDDNGEVMFVSIFPGWYPGRAPHIHVEIVGENSNTMLATQISFDKSICDLVYATQYYKGTADTTNERDGAFRDGVEGNMPDSLAGNINDGYILVKTIVI